MAKLTFLECSKCGEKLSADQPWNICPKDGGPLYARYDLDAIRNDKLARDSVAGGPKTMWRYQTVLPDAEPVSLGEGMTPLLPSRVHKNLLIKDEGLNPTGSFKARGMSAAVHDGAALRAEETRGTIGRQRRRGALAAYAAAAGAGSLRLHAQRCAAGEPP